MNEMILRGIYQVMVDILNEMKRLNNTLESRKINTDERDVELCENQPISTDTVDRYPDRYKG